MSKDQPSSENSDLAQPSEAAGLMGMLRGVVASDWLAAAQPSEPQDSPPGPQPLESPKKPNDAPTKPTVDFKCHDVAHLKVRCPHCHNPIEVVDGDPSGDVSCPSCGSCFNLAKDSETARYLDSGRMLGHFQLLDRLGKVLLAKSGRLATPNWIGWWRSSFRAANISRKRRRKSSFVKREPPHKCGIRISSRCTKWGANAI